jgi:hypothetical protein
MAAKIDSPDENDAARDRRVYLEQMGLLQSKNTRLEDIIAGLQAEGRRYRDEIAARPAPPEIWWPLPKACVIDGDRTERQRATDYENMRRRCDNKSIIARKEGAGRGLWWVRMEANLDGRMVPMLEK